MPLNRIFLLLFSGSAILFSLNVSCASGNPYQDNESEHPTCLADLSVDVQDADILIPEPFAKKKGKSLIENSSGYNSIISYIQFASLKLFYPVQITSDDLFIRFRSLLL